MKCSECGKQISIDEEINSFASKDAGLCNPCRRNIRLKKATPMMLLPQSVPPRYIQEINGNPFYQAAGKVDKFYRHGPYLRGATGSGKSCQAASLMFFAMKQALQDRVKVSFDWVNVPQLLFNIRQSFSDSEGGGEKHILQHYSEVGWLCLDDLGVEKSTDWVLQTLYLIVNTRYENNRPTCVTCNLDPDALAERMGDDRLASRLRAMCPVYEVGNQDRRKKGK